MGQPSKAHMPPSVDSQATSPGLAFTLLAVPCVLAIAAIALFVARRLGGPDTRPKQILEQHDERWLDPESCLIPLDGFPSELRSSKSEAHSYGSPVDANHQCSPAAETKDFARKEVVPKLVCEMCGKGPFTSLEQAAEHERSKGHRAMLSAEQSKSKRKVKPQAKPSVVSRQRPEQQKSAKPRVEKGPMEGAEHNFASRGQRLT